MSDRRLRELERRTRTQAAPEDLARLDAARARAAESSLLPVLWEQEAEARVRALMPWIVPALLNGYPASAREFPALRRMIGDTFQTQLGTYEERHWRIVMAAEVVEHGQLLQLASLGGHHVRACTRDGRPAGLVPARTRAEAGEVFVALTRGEGTARVSLAEWGRRIR